MLKIDLVNAVYMINASNSFVLFRENCSLAWKKKKINPAHAEVILFHLKRLELMHGCIGSVFTESRFEKPQLLLSALPIFDTEKQGNDFWEKCP